MYSGQPTCSQFRLLQIPWVPSFDFKVLILIFIFNICYVDIKLVLMCFSASPFSLNAEARR